MEQVQVVPVINAEDPVNQSELHVHVNPMLLVVLLKNADLPIPTQEMTDNTQRTHKFSKEIVTAKISLRLDLAQDVHLKPWIL